MCMYTNVYVRSCVLETKRASDTCDIKVLGPHSQCPAEQIRFIPANQKHQMSYILIASQQVKTLVGVKGRRSRTIETTVATGTEAGG